MIERIKTMFVTETHLMREARQLRDNEYRHESVEYVYAMLTRGSLS